MKKKGLFIAMIILLGFVGVYSITVGTANISKGEVVSTISSFLLGNEYDDVKSRIILNIRLPRILVAGLVGSGLAVAGASYQGMFKNPLADPYVLGVSAGAALGATIAIVLNMSGSNIVVIPILAFIGAIISVTLVYNIGKISGKLSSSILILAGVAVSSLFNSIISLIMVMNRDATERILYWTMGSFNASTYKNLMFLLPTVLLGSFFIYLEKRSLNIIAAGEEEAYTLGIEVEKVKRKLILISTLMVAVIVSVSGIIGFVGFIIPHITRVIVGANHRELIPFSAVIGAIFIILCDTIARVAISPTELPVGIVTAMFGGPYFIYLLWKKRGV